MANAAGKLWHTGYRIERASDDARHSVSDDIVIEESTSETSERAGERLTVYYPIY